MQEEQSFLASLFSFNIAVVAGIITAFVVQTMVTEAQPLTSFLFSSNLYIVTSLIAFALRILLWVTMDKGAMFEVSQVLVRAIQDIIVINIVLLSTLSFLFLWETFL